MDKDIELYFKGQDNNSKLIYTVGILWGKVSSNLDEILNKYGLNNLEKSLYFRFSIISGLISVLSVTLCINFLHAKYFL